jgi:non-canonical (house-cleaning) NTP pyrophosphatase
MICLAPFAECCDPVYRDFAGYDKYETIPFSANSPLIARRFPQQFFIFRRSSFAKLAKIAYYTADKIMSKSLIAVGSTRGPKLDAVHDALKLCAEHLNPNAQFEVMGFAVDSGVGHTPLSSVESMRGARQRTETLIRMASGKGEVYQYFVGLEGGLEVMQNHGSHESHGDDTDSTGNGGRRVFLESWAYVSDGSRGHFGCSGGIELPPALAHEVLDNGVELADAIDKFAGMAGIRDNQGAWGVLSNNLITRREAFSVALVAAFAPFYNVNLFRVGRAAG